jgi:hypothetical protein
MLSSENIVGVSNRQYNEGKVKTIDVAEYISSEDFLEDFD